MIQKILDFNKLPQEARRERMQKAVPPTTAAGFEANLGKGRFSNKNSIHVADGLRFLMGLTEDDLKVMNELRKQVPPADWESISREALNHPSWKALQESDRFPDRGLYLRTLANALNTALERKGVRPRHPEPTPLAGETPCEEERVGPLQTTFEAQHKGNCTGCHEKESAGSLRFPFDPEDREAWGLWWKDKNKKPQAVEWRKKILDRLKDKKRPMPPTDSEEHDRFTAEKRASLIRFLNSLTP